MGINWRGGEWFLLFVCAPIAWTLVRWQTGLWSSPFIAAFLAVSRASLLRDDSFDRRDLFRPEALRSGWKGVVFRFIPLAALLGLIVILTRPAPLFAFPRKDPSQWLLFSALFPVAPAYVEEFIFRVFFLHRYRPLFPKPLVRMAACAFSFSRAHVHLANVWPLSLSFLGSLLFARTFERSRSAALVSWSTRSGESTCSLSASARSSTQSSRWEDEVNTKSRLPTALESNDKEDPDDGSNKNRV